MAQVQADVELLTVARNQREALYFDGERYRRDLVEFPEEEGLGGRQRKRSDRLRDQEVPSVLGYELDRESLTPVRERVDVSAEGDYGADVVGDGTFRMVPSGDIVDIEERERRLRRFRTRSLHGSARGLGAAMSSCEELPAVLDRAEIALEVGDSAGLNEALRDYTDTVVKRRCKTTPRFFELESAADRLRGGRRLSGLRGHCEAAQREAARALREAKTPAQRRAAQKFLKQVKSRCGLGRLRSLRLGGKR